MSVNHYKMDSLRRPKCRITRQLHLLEVGESSIEPRNEPTQQSLRGGDAKSGRVSNCERDPCICGGMFGAPFPSSA
jgi:hypothetical protein